MTDAGEVAADIGLEYVVHLLGHDLQAQRLQSVVRVAPRSKAVTAVEEIRFKHGLDNARYRPLQQPIRDRGHGYFELHIGPVSLWDRPRSLIPFIPFEVISLLS